GEQHRVGHEDEGGGAEEQAGRRAGRAGRPGPGRDDAAQDARDEAGLERGHGQGDDGQLRLAGAQRDPAGEHGHERRLRGEERQPRRQALPPHQSEGERQHAGAHEVHDGGEGRRRHRRKKNAATESRLTTKDPLSSSGTRNSRSLATAVSSTATAMASTPSFTTSAAAPSRTAGVASAAGTPQGTKRFASRARKRRSFIAPAHSTSAR